MWVLLNFHLDFWDDHFLMLILSVLLCKFWSCCVLCHIHLVSFTLFSSFCIFCVVLVLCLFMSYSSYCVLRRFGLVASFMSYSSCCVFYIVLVFCIFGFCCCPCLCPSVICHLSWWEWTDGLMQRWPSSFSLHIFTFHPHEPNPNSFICLCFVSSLFNDHRSLTVDIFSLQICGTDFYDTDGYESTLRSNSVTHDFICSLLFSCVFCVVNVIFRCF